MVRSATLTDSEGGTLHEAYGEMLAGAPSRRPYEESRFGWLLAVAHLTGVLNAY